MQRFLLSTIVFGVVALFVAGAALTALRAEAKGPLTANSADLLDVTGSLGGLRVPLMATGGLVINLASDGAIVRDRQGRTRRITFGRHVVFEQRGAIVTADAVEPGAHLAVLGLPANNSRNFFAYKVRILPHHHAIGGRVEHLLAGGFAQIADHRGSVSFVTVPRTAPITLRGRSIHGGLRVDMHVLTLSVPDPRQLPGFYIADAVHVLVAPVKAHVGGLIRTIDAQHGVITIYSKTKGLVYTIEVRPQTRVTLSRWTAGYADMVVGDHMTVSGVVDASNPTHAPNPILARTIRLSSPTFSGVITAIARATDGSAVITVRGRRGHVLRIAAAGRVGVIYGTESAHVPDLIVGEKIVAHGTRTEKFELMAASIRVYPRQRTVGGTVSGRLPGSYRIVDTYNNTQYVIHTIASTTYARDGHPTATAVIAPGTHIKVRAYDELHNDQRGIPVLIATHISIIVHHAHVHHISHKVHPTRGHAAPPAKARPTPLAQPTPRPTLRAAAA